MTVEPIIFLLSCPFLWLPGSGTPRAAEGLEEPVGVGQLLERERRGRRTLRVSHRFRPRYRVHFGKDGEAIVILLAGGTKKRQDRDIAKAHERWADYKHRKGRG